jgi:hypothetical protein
MPPKLKYTTVTDENGEVRKVHLRRAHKKSHLGCQKCKKRRIKCDEQVPVCGQCKRGNIDCSYSYYTELQLKEHIEKREASKAIATTVFIDATSTNLEIDTKPAGTRLVPQAQLPLTEKINNLPKLERRNMNTTIAITRQGFETDFMRNAYSNWMDNTLALAYHHTCLYHALLAFSFSFASIKTKKEVEKLYSDRHRFVALREMQQGLLKVSPANTDALLSSSLILSWDVFLREGDIAGYITLTRGLGAVLEKVQKVSSTTQMALCMTESLFQAVKNILHPPYEDTFFVELKETIKNLVVEDNQLALDPVLKPEYEFLVDYVTRMEEFLRKSPRSASEKNRFPRDPCGIFSFMREWIGGFPSMALNLDILRGENKESALVLYSYFHAVTRAMDAIMPEARYLFQFSFIGPIDLVSPETCITLTECKTTRVRLDYPLKIIKFFKTRQLLLNRQFLFADPLKTATPLTPPQPEPVDETFVTSFQAFSIDTAGAYLPVVRESTPSSCASTVVTSPLSSVSPESTSPHHTGFRRESSATVGSTRSDCELLGKPENHPDAPSPSVSDLGGIDLGLSSLSLGMFRPYFDDRMRILERYVVGQ